MEAQAGEYRYWLEALTGAWRGLPDKPEETPEATLESLWRHAAGTCAGPGLPALEEGALARLRELVRRRIAGEPLGYLTGLTRFMGSEFESGPEAMIPRAETEILARAALGLLQEMPQGSEPLVVIDLCTGSGNVGLALALREPRCRLFGGDISEGAVRLAARNAARLGLQDRAEFRVGDFLEPFRRAGLPPAALITCNPPYISTASVARLPTEILGFEPKAAFDGGPFGLSLLMRLIKEGFEFLGPGGWVACETGLGQGEVVANMFKRSNNYRSVNTFQDAQGAIRAVAARV